MSALAVVMVSGLTLVSMPGAAVADPGGGHDRTQAAMDAAVRVGVPGVLVGAYDGKSWWDGAAGVADRTTGRPPQAGDHFRAGSITKTFVATVVLQLEAKGRLRLDDTVEKWLPGMVRGNGNDGSKITIKQLLNHTSGLFDYTKDHPAAKWGTKQWLDHRSDTFKPEQLVALAVSHRPTHQPGGPYNYCNTDYVLAALIIEKVTGHSFESELRQRIIEPLGLTGTVLPGTDKTLPSPHGRGYTEFLEEPGVLHDVTEYNPSFIRGTGDLITTTGDLDRFLAALLSGRLLPPAQMKEMTTKVPGSNYGLGLATWRTACGVEVWGHNGVWAGTEAWTVGTRDAKRRLSLNFNNGLFFGHETLVGDIVNAEFCPPPNSR
ncbi:serine hydrolase domain-containing protein [Streptomyces roseifaciens]|uniref:serine hydrolase domain-containing protein n=1 Tax=Streptomyces roseifaciens TaxID=1488406 RepID=UPI001FDEC49D|nr:serine hydrolase domain-containing protein [Streptomyces roseifaciens]